MASDPILAFLLCFSEYILMREREVWIRMMMVIRMVTVKMMILVKMMMMTMK